MEKKSKVQLSTIAMAIFVRLLLVLHTLVATWRVTLAWDDPRYWLISLGVLLIALEGYITIRVNGGIEWKWICPCFAIYMGITLPLIWLLEISQMNRYLDSHIVSTITTTAKVTSTTTTVQTVTSAVTSVVTEGMTVFSNISMATTGLNASDVQNVTMTSVNTTTDMATSTVPMTTTTKGGIREIFTDIENLLGSFNADTWVVVVEESLVYLIVIGRWLLPRGRGTREELSDLLMDYLAMASDIMELFALFDEDSIRRNETLTYAILAIWSISFIQFIPVVLNRRAANAFRKATKRNGGKSCCTCAGCGDSFPEIFVTLTGLFLQDGPFLALRLFIIIYLQIITYSLVFFVVKNIIVVLLLTYRLGILCFHLPCCHKPKTAKDDKTLVQIQHAVNHGFEDVIIDKNDQLINDSDEVKTTDSGKFVHQVDDKNTHYKQKRPTSTGSSFSSHGNADCYAEPTSNRSSGSNGSHAITGRSANAGSLARTGRRSSFDIFDGQTPLDEGSTIRNGSPARTGSLTSNDHYVRTGSLVDPGEQSVRTNTTNSSSPNDFVIADTNRYSIDRKDKGKHTVLTPTHLRTTIRVGYTGNDLQNVVYLTSHLNRTCGSSDRAGSARR